MLPIFAKGQFTRIYCGTTAFMFGTSILLIVLSMWVKTLTDSNSLAGLTFLFTTAPALVLPFIGQFLDRLPRRQVMVYGNVLTAASLLFLLLVDESGDVWIIWLVAVIYGFAMIVLPATLNGLLKAALNASELPVANSAIQTTKQALRLIGPLIGAALFAMDGRIWPIVLVTSMALVSAGVLFIGVRIEEVAPDHEPASLVGQLKGFNFLMKEPVLRRVVVAIAMMTAVIGFYESAIYALLEGFAEPVASAASLVTAQGVGAIGAGLVTSTIVRRVGEARTLAVGLILLAASLAATAVAGSFHWVLGLAVVMGAGLPLISVATTTLVQIRTPQQLMARVSLVVEFLATGPQTISLALGALLVATVDWRFIFGLMAMSIAAGAIFMLLPGRRSEPGVATSTWSESELT